MVWLVIALLVGGFVFWMDELRARDLALTVARQQTDRLGLQLLDETVSRNRLRVLRSERGWPAFARLYTFEFSETGDNRRLGFVSLGPDRPPHVELEAYADRPVWH